ncbi:HIT domain-containing protein [Candidatus Woesearchaeota archaeon]|nr:HIT domain-containing protein [Candidatus Woesearchaeota archaeon]
MVQLSAEQQKAIEQQKANCPFCKIIKGDIPSQKVYEDDKCIAILDINPAYKGHTLLVPKEHYPILPLVPEEAFEHLAKTIKELSGCIKKGALVFGDNVFIANGAVAGQQSQHMVIHIIPREKGDMINIFSLKPGKIDQEKEAEVAGVLTTNMARLMRKRYAKYPLPNQPTIAPGTYTKEQIIGIIEQNPPIKNMIIADADRFKAMIPKNPQFNAIFGKCNIDEIIAEIKQKEQVNKPIPEEEEKPSRSKEEELLKLIEENPKIKEMMLHDFPLFKQKVADIPQLKEMFEGFNLDEIKKKLEAKEEGKTKEKQKEEPADDLDLIARLMK